MTQLDKTKMEHEIEKRMKSDIWNRKIADSVIKEKVRQKKKRRIYTSSASLLAGAAVIAVFLTVGTNREKKVKTPYSKFITTQIDGTYDTVFKDESRYSDDIDSMIEETLARR